MRFALGMLVVGLAVYWFQRKANQDADSYTYQQWVALLADSDLRPPRRRF